MRKNVDDITKVNFYDVVREFECKFPLLFKMMVCIAIPGSKDGMACDVLKLSPQLALCYGIIMKQNFHELSFIQRVNSILLLDSIADKKVQ